jgi:hypothetical protein
MPSEAAQRGSERTPPKKPEWKTNETLAVGKGATVQEFVATVGEDRLEIDGAVRRMPWQSLSLYIGLSFYYQTI